MSWLLRRHVAKNEDDEDDDDGILGRKWYEYDDGIPCILFDATTAACSLIKLFTTGENICDDWMKWVNTKKDEYKMKKDEKLTKAE